MKPLSERIEEQVAAGRPWRAKEIVRGNLAWSRPDDAVLERYGQILLALGEQLEAGKYLFLSAARNPEYEAAIALFLARHSRGGPKALLAQLPRTFRRLAFSDFSPQLQREFIAAGVTASTFGLKPHRRAPVPSNQSFRNALGAVVGLGILVCLIVGIAVVSGPS
jgi:hypothetical protein